MKKQGYMLLSKISSLTIILLVSLGVVNLLENSSALAAGHTIFVNNLNKQPEDGKSWASAFPSLTTALEEALEGDQIWVAAGAYTPSSGNNRSASFQLKEGVEVYGGFSGKENRLDQRDWEKNKTLLSGDIGRKDYSEDNCYQVVKGADQAVLDGFIITGGYSLNAPSPGPGGPGAGAPPSGSPPGSRRPGGPPGGGPPIHITPDLLLRGANFPEGAGMINYQAAPIVRNCIFADNSAKKGGGVYNMNTKVFPPPRGMDGPVPTFINCVFEDNFADARGGGVANDLATNAVFLNCIFRGNDCREKGGGMYNDFGCSPFVLNCLFLENKADNAAAMGNDGASHPVIYYTTFTKNRARTSGPSVYLGTGPSNNPAVLNSIIWGNECDWGDPGIYAWHDNSPRVEDSVIEGGYSGNNNIGVDPKLAIDGSSTVDAGYKPESSKFSLDKLSDLLAGLKPYVNQSRPGPPRHLQKEEDPVLPTSERIIYVNGALSATGDGKGWESAYASLNDALNDAAKDGAQIWVAAGTYKPSIDDRTESFLLMPGVRLYGGFTGTETDLSQRGAGTNRTILSGDIGQTDLSSDNSYHVLIGADGTVLDGFTVTGGYADGIAYDSHGGGMITYKRGIQGPPGGPRTGYSPKISNCRFIKNYAKDGGAVYNYDRGKPEFIDCVFEKNNADYGGAVLDRVGVYAVYQGCTFQDNRSKWGGGALLLDYGSRPKFNDCLFTGNNTTAGHGGAIFTMSRASQLENTVATFERCVIKKNSAKGDGGGAAFTDNSIAELNECSVHENNAGRNGGGIAVTGRSQFKDRGSKIEKNHAEGKKQEIYYDASSM